MGVKSVKCFSKKSQCVRELITVLNTLGLASSGVAGLMKTQKFLGENSDNALEAISEAVEDMLKEWGWR